MWQPHLLRGRQATETTRSRGRSSSQQVCRLVVRERARVRDGQWSRKTACGCYGPQLRTADARTVTNRLLLPRLSEETRGRHRACGTRVVGGVRTEKVRAVGLQRATSTSRTPRTSGSTSVSHSWSCSVVAPGVPGSMVSCGAPCRVVENSWPLDPLGWARAAGAARARATSALRARERAMAWRARLRQGPTAPREATFCLPPPRH